ncbi:sacsin N-terminal ATP-binding-like domain-containing protein [Thioalkalivibrio sp. HK1]|uniref:sacsin N-terminal ATP-binding-like domain-containing protein n=1 Tax=Thioalkalivibrio sp. HK1 TaxID=1469245 RepID=UPI00046F15A9|nr:hypothetical protein [Thioalkalivibrio sp. HK1]
MASNYNEICKQNIKQYGEGTRHLEFLGRLYSDRTHFIYELLQNAEDKDAKRVRFNLYKDRLEFLHDGTPFDEEDIRGICGIGEGTKSDDLTKIGKFGIGFKSVYAYTSSPRIHCGDENFRIEFYVRPSKEKEIKISSPWTTKFIFPFDLPSIPSEKAYNEIVHRLITLNVRTLLFLRNIEEIEWKTDEGESGIYIRSSKRRKHSRHITIVGNHNNYKEEESWLVFEKNINDPDGNPIKPIEIAYKIEGQEIKDKSKGKNKIKKSESIICLHNSPLFVFFATEKDTRLGFLLQGPYITTPARDNIPKDNHWNAYLLEKSAMLVVESLRHLKSMKLLSVSVLEAMPIIEKDFPPDSMFRNLYDSVAKSLMEKEFLPTDSGGYVNASNAKIGRGEDVRNILSSSQLTDIYGDTHSIEEIDRLQWLSGEITEDRTPELRKYLMQKLGIEEINPENFSQRVTPEFFERQSDDWLVNLYKFLLRQEALWRAPRSLYRWDSGGAMRYQPFVRLEDNRQVKAFEADGSVAIYLPQKSADGLPCIKKNLIEDNDAREFFVRLGVKEPDITSEVIEHILPLYEPDEVEISDSDHVNHISLIIQALQVDSMERRKILTNKLKNSYFLYAKNATGEKARTLPYETYSRNPNLEIYLEDNPDAWFLDERYSKEEIDMFLNLGVHDNIIIYEREVDRRGHIIVHKDYGFHKRGLNGFDPNFWVDQLDFAVQHPNISRSLFIWENIAYPFQKHFRGSVQESSNKDYIDSEPKIILSKMGEMLSSNAWLPDKKGVFHKPSDLSLDDLPDEFERFDDLASHLEMIGSELNGLAQKAGLDVSSLDIARRLQSMPSDARQRIEEQIAEEEMRAKSTFPDHPSSNPERRSHRAMKRADEAPYKETEERIRNVRTSTPIGDKKAYLREFYTNEAVMFCQICENKDAKPFRGRDNEYYFEAVQIFDDLSKEHEAAHIALCPLCAAKFKEFIKKDKNESQRQRIWNDLVNLDIKTAKKLRKELRVRLDLGQEQEEKSIRFGEKHLIDVQQILKVEGRIRKNPSS